VSGRSGASVEHRLRDRLTARRTELVDLAARLVRIPSDGPDHDEREVVAALAHAAFALGLPAGEIVAAEAGRPNLVIRIAGVRPGRRLVLNGHTDTKPPGDLARWPGDPWAGELRDGRLHGLGAADMKGALAAMLHAAAALREEDLPADGELVLVFSADEEASGTLGLAHVLAATGLAADAAIIGEPSGIDDAFDRLAIGARGFYGFTLRATGQRRHSGLVESSGPAGAIAALVRAVDRLPAAVDLGDGPSEAFPLGPSLTFTAIEAGVAPGIVPDEATARGEVRTVPGMTHAGVTKALRAALDVLRDEAGARLAVTLEPDPEIWPASAIDAGEPIVSALAAATAAVLGRAPRPGVFPGATEAHVFAARGIPCVPAYGPGRLAAAHVPDESVALAEIEAAAAIYALTAARFLG
jgi:acetylornithine deacetylase/succinyl-diaminopimelate desuccinylase-like protein